MPRVLVVDNDPMVCMAIEIYLERHDFQVTIADGGEAGLRALLTVIHECLSEVRSRLSRVAQQK